MRKSHQSFLFFMYAMMAFILVRAQAQIAPPPNYDQKLGDLVVNATRSGTSLDEMPLNTTILTEEALEKSPDQTIDQVLKNVPGVFLMMCLTIKKILLDRVLMCAD